MATQVRELMADPRRRQLAIVGALFLVLLALVWFFLLRGGGEPAEAPAPVPAAEDPVEPQTPAASRDPAKGGGGAVETFEVFASRDPFEPLVSAQAAASTAAGDSGGGDTATFIGGGSGSDPSDGSVGSASDGSGSVGGHRVRVIDVYQARQGTTAQVEVDGTVYRAQEGETFAGSFRLVEASGRCATLLFGDDQFTLCEGEEILK